MRQMYIYYEEINQHAILVNRYQDEVMWDQNTSMSTVVNRLLAYFICANGNIG